MPPMTPETALSGFSGVGLAPLQALALASSPQATSLLPMLGTLLLVGTLVAVILLRRDRRRANEGDPTGEEIESPPSEGHVEIQVAERTRELEEHSRELQMVNIRLEREIRAARAAEKARRELEERMQEHQRLESLGVLAGGLAHDFNNLLVGIMGSAELARMDLGPDSPVDENLRDILEAAERAAHLCRQMLAYAGKAPFHTANLDLSAVVEGVSELLDTSVSKKIRLEMELEASLSTIGADRNQLEQVIVNLVMNAAEAIGDHAGSIRITTGEREIGLPFLRAHGHTADQLPGQYVYLEVRDTGQGMSPEVLQKIFEPFFTTKFLGRGLGLAAVFGILRRHHGFVTVDSVAGEGSQFRAWFPVAAGAVVPAVQRERQLQLLDHSDVGVVLVVDDEEMVRNLVRTALDKEGYGTVTADDGLAGISTLEEMGDQVGCILLDMTMPRMDGEAALREMKSIAPDIPVVIMSGHSEKQIFERFTNGEVADFLPKPFTLEQLRNAVKGAITEHRGSRGDSRHRLGA